MIVRPFTSSDRAEWQRLRHALWPETTALDHENDLAEYLGSPDSHVILVAARPDGRLAGFAEVRLRSHADECATSPVAFLEGWYVDQDVRRTGLGRALVEAGEAWARGRGCREFASDTEASNAASVAAHRALGFAEGPPAINFRKTL